MIKRSKILFYVLILSFAWTHNVFLKPNQKKVVSNKDTKSLRIFFASLGLEYIDKIRFDWEDPNIKNCDRIMKSSEQKMTFDERQRYNRYAGYLKYADKKKTTKKAPSLCIKHVSDHVGYGVFAQEDIKKGSFVAEYVGTVTTRPPASSDHYNYDYFEDDSDIVLASRNSGNETQFINHSSNANVEWQSMIGKDSKRHIILVACQDIKKEDQLLVDYGESYWEDRKNDLVQLAQNK